MLLRTVIVTLVLTALFVVPAVPAGDTTFQNIYTEPTTTDRRSAPYSGADPDTIYLARFTFDSGPMCVAEGWISVDLSDTGGGGFGDFAGLYPGIAVVQEDPCGSQLDCVWSFFSGSGDNYGCGQWPAQEAVPLGGPAGYIHNEIWSPPIDWSINGSVTELRFTVYRDLRLERLVFYTWRVRSLSGGVPGDWRSRETGYYGDGADWFRKNYKIGDLIEPGADQIQIALGVADMCAEWCGILGEGNCHSHAPLFDDVDVYQLDRYRPEWFVHPVDLFQDNFAGDGSLTGTVRCDAARDILPRTSSSIRPGDSVVVHVGDPGAGLDYHVPGVPSSGPAVYLHVKDVSAAKSGAAITGDSHRWPMVSVYTGWTTLRFDSVRTAGGETVPGRFCVDLNDELYTPGDTVWFHFSARNANGATSYWTEFIGTFETGTTPGLEAARAAAMEMTCLPTFSPRTTGKILYVDDADFRGVQEWFDSAFEMLHVAGDVDRYDVRGASYLAGNGPGSRVVDIEQQILPVYQVIIWCSGGLSAGLVGDGSGSPEKSPDAQLLTGFLDGSGLGGGLYISGDDMAGEWDRLNSPAIETLAGFMEHVLVSGSHLRSGFGVTPYVNGEQCSPFEYRAPDGSPVVEQFVAYGGCPVINDFDVITPSGEASLGAGYSNTGGGSNTEGAIVYQETENAGGSRARAILSGFSYHNIRDAFPSAVPARVRHLQNILGWFGTGPVVGRGIWPRITMRGTGVEVGWDLDTRCNVYSGVNVYRQAPSDARVLLNTDGPVPVPRTFLDTDVEVGIVYMYRIGAIDDGREELSWPVFVPVELLFSAMTVTPGPAGIDLSWRTESAADFDGFKVFRRTDTEPFFERIDGPDLLPPSATGFVDRNYDITSRYEYKVAAFTGADSLETEPVAVSPPSSLGLAQNVPNPFNPETTIAFNMPGSGQARLTIYDVGGHHVITLLDESRPGGYNEAVWNGLDARGVPSASGVYFYRLEAFGESLTSKMVMVR